MKASLLAVSLSLLFVTSAEAVPVVAGDPNWQILITDSSGTPGLGTGSGQFVTGPSTPPLGAGSFNFVPGSGNQGVELRTGLFAGTTLSSIIATNNSSYATFASSTGATDQLPFITLWIDNNNDTLFDDRLFFEPFWNTDAAIGAGNGQAASVLLNTWQTWDLANGFYYSQNNFPSLVFDLAFYTSTFASATIVNPPGAGGFRFATGYASSTDVFNTNIDALVFNGSVFDFENAPELQGSSASVPTVFALLMLTLIQSRRRKYAL